MLLRCKNREPVHGRGRCVWWSAKIAADGLELDPRVLQGPPAKIYKFLRAQRWRGVETKVILMYFAAVVASDNYVFSEDELY